MPTTSAPLAGRHLARSAGVLIVVIAVLVGTIGPAAAQYRRSPAVQTPALAQSDGLVHPQPAVSSPPRAADEVVIAEGQAFAPVFAAHPAGTRYRIAAGTHRAQVLDVEDGDVVTGDDGAVLDGTIVLPTEGFRPSGAAWVLGGRAEHPFTADGTPTGPLHGEMVDGHEREAANHDLWIDGTRLRHVNSRAEVAGPQTWFFDYATDEVLIGRNPAGSTVELSTAQAAAWSDADGVHIRHLTITRYASPAQHGAIHIEGSGWSVEHVTISDNHGAGIKVGPSTTLSDSRITGNGQIGVTAWSGQGIVIERNEIAGNLTLGYEWGWEGGATKLKGTEGAIFRNNWVHDNAGPGIWFDIDNVDAVIRGNVVEGNRWAGVLYEISYGATIADNTIRNNGQDAYGDLGGGIWVSNSSDVEVTGNLMYGNRVEVIATHDERGSGLHGRYETRGLQVHHNEVETGPVRIGLRVRNGEDHLYASGGNRFWANTYHLAPGSSQFWWDGDRSSADWQQLGHDQEGTFVDGYAPARLPQEFAAASYGHL